MWLTKKVKMVPGGEPGVPLWQVPLRWMLVISLSPILNFKFRNQYELKARDTTELHTMKVGGAGCYRIVGMTAKRVK